MIPVNRNRDRTEMSTAVDKDATGQPRQQQRGELIVGQHADGFGTEDRGSYQGESVSPNVRQTIQARIDDQSLQL
jgi:hypothetical protein